MKNKLFFSSLIMTAILFTGFNSSFAISDTLQFTVPNFFNIGVDSSSVVTGDISYKSNNTLTLDSPIVVTYNVSSNISYSAVPGTAGGNTVGISASVPIANSSSETIDLHKGKMIFTRADRTTTSSAVANITQNSPNASNNANAIAFPIICTDSDDYDDGYLLYNVHGTKQITCTISGDSISGTYGSNDALGNYTAEIIMTRVEADD